MTPNNLDLHHPPQLNGTVCTRYPGQIIQLLTHGNKLYVVDQGGVKPAHLQGSKGYTTAPCWEDYIRIPLPLVLGGWIVELLRALQKSRHCITESTLHIILLQLGLNGKNLVSLINGRYSKFFRLSQLLDLPPLSASEEVSSEALELCRLVPMGVGDTGFTLGAVKVRETLLPTVIYPHVHHLQGNLMTTWGKLEEEGVLVRHEEDGVVYFAVELFTLEANIGACLSTNTSALMCTVWEGLLAAFGAGSNVARFTALFTASTLAMCAFRICTAWLRTGGTWVAARLRALTVWTL